MADDTQMEWFKESINSARERLNVLHPPTSGPQTDNSGLVPMLFEELHVSLEELQVSGEEIRQQNDALLESQSTLAEERKRYQDLFDGAPDPYIITDKEGQIQEANRAAQEMLGISIRRLSGKPLAIYVAADARASFRSCLKACQYAEMPAPWETMMHPRGREAFPAAISVSASRDAAGNIVALRWLVRDVTERHHWEQMLQDANRDLEERIQERTRELEAAHTRMEEILESITDAFYALDSELRFTYVNRTAERLWRRPRAEFLGRDIREALPQLAGSYSLSEIERAMAERTARFFETFSPVIGHWVEVSVYPSDGGGLAIYFRDITERKEAESERKRRMEHDHHIAHALQTNLMQTISENMVPGFAISTLYRAASEEALIGGDFYDVFTFDHGKAALVVGDVSGKGLSAAAHIAEVKYALRAFLRETNSPGAALARLNDSVCEAQRQDDGGNMALVVLALLTLDPKTNQAEYASAGAEPLLVLAPDGETIEEHGQSSGLVLGAAPKREYQETTLTVPPGALLALATDGITEARREGDMLGLDGLKRMVHEANRLGSVQDISREIMDRARAYTGGALTDDACLLVARRHPPSEAKTAETDSRAPQMTSSEAP